MSQAKFFPDSIKANPEVKVQVPGIRAWKVKGPSGLVVFFEIEKGTEVPAHAHCFQWGVVVEGKMEITIGGKQRVCKRGDNYQIPEGVEHRARFLERTLAIDFFSDPERYG